MKKNDTKTKQYKKVSGSSSTKSTTKNPAAKRKTAKTNSTSQKSNIPLIICGILLVALLILTFINFGTVITLITAVGIAIIIGIAKLLERAKNKKRQKKVINITLIVLLILGILGLILLSAFLIYITIKAPKFDPKLLDSPEVSIFYDKDGNEFAKLGTEMREKITYDELPEVLIDAIIATEDSRFFQHNGFDAPRFLKASVGQIGGNSDAGGASTLSMQVIKNSFTSTESTGVAGVVRKFTDIYLAVFKLEKNYTKEQIIEFYVNNHFLGGNIYGVQEASLAYFGKNVQDLNLSEAAILAGMFKSPNYYRPNANPKNASERRDTVLYLMQKHGYISKEEKTMAASIPVESLTAESTNASTNEYQAYIDTVASEMEDKYKVNPYVTPVLVYTNMDRGKQEGVNKVMNGESYQWINEKVQAGVSVLDTGSGKILAIGNGRNREGANNFNYATDIKRQPGSTAKPLFDYGPGIEYNNWSTYTPFDDAPYTYSNGRSISNWDNGYFGTLTLRRALSTSRNIPALKAFQQVDNKKVIEFVTNLGIKPEVENGQIHEAHSIGAFTGVSPLEMSAAYAAFSNGGYYNEPYAVSKFEYRETGKTVEHKGKTVQAMSDATAFMISSVLQDVALTGGTPTNVAAKTGTTNYDSNTMKQYGLPNDAVRDSWVIGYTTKTVIGLWYGYDFIDSEYCLRNVPATIQKDKIFLALANNVFEKNKEEFKMPDSVVKLGIVAGSNPPRIAGAGSGSVVYEYFKKGHEPSDADVAQKLATPTNLKASFANGKTSLTWTGVGKLSNDESYGTFGYNVYFNDTLIAFTESTSFSYTTSSPYGTYKVVATYKSYDGAQSDAATYTLKEEVAEDNIETTAISQSAKTTSDSVPTTLSSLVTVKNNGTDVTSQCSNVTISSVSYTDSGGTTTNPTANASAFSNGPGTYSIVYSFVFNGKTYKTNAITFTVT